MGYSWNWSALLTLKPYSDESYLSSIMQGFLMTIFISLSAWFIALFLGMLLGVLRTLPSLWLKRIVSVYVNVFRNTPLLAQLFLGFFVLPELLPPTLSMAVKQMQPIKQQLLVAIFVLGLFTSARLIEQFRAGLDALPTGQKNAGLALGLELSQVYRFILLPLVLRTMIPSLTSELLNIFKNSAICSTIGVVELSYQASNLAECQDICLPYEAFIIITIFYLTINLIIAQFMDKLEKRLHINGLIGKNNV